MAREGRTERRRERGENGSQREREREERMGDLSPQGSLKQSVSHLARPDIRLPSLIPTSLPPKWLPTLIPVFPIASTCLFVPVEAA